MNKEWSEINKTMQKQLNNKSDFNEGIQTLIKLRETLMKQIMDFKVNLSDSQMCAIPYINADGYHSKTIAYSLYHIFRIEDIVAHTIIMNNEEIFFQKDYQNKMHSPIITTGNELIKLEITDFSKKLAINELFNYIKEVDEATKKILCGLTYEDLKRKFSDKDKERVRELHVVAECEEAKWLIDYWCDKDIKGLIKMPFSRHWIMHIEACLRIEKKVL